MEGPVIASLCFSGVACFGVVYTVWKNGKAARDKDEELKRNMQNNINTINARLDSPNAGLQAIKDAVEDTRGETQAQKEHCIQISTKVMEQIKTHEKDIDVLKRGGGK